MKKNITKTKQAPELRNVVEISSLQNGGGSQNKANFIAVINALNTLDSDTTSALANKVDVAANITAGTAGSASETLVLTYNSQGELTAVTAEAISINASNITGANTVNGVVVADANGKILADLLPSGITGGMNFKGTFDASAGLPSQSNPNAGDYWIVDVAGMITIGGVDVYFAVGDFCIYADEAWNRLTGTFGVTSVNGQTGLVALTTSDIGEGSNLYYTAARAQGDVVTQEITEGDTTYAPSANAVLTLINEIANALTASDISYTTPQGLATTVAGILSTYNDNIVYLYDANSYNFDLAFAAKNSTDAQKWTEQTANYTLDNIHKKVRFTGIGGTLTATLPATKDAVEFWIKNDTANDMTLQGATIETITDKIATGAVGGSTTYTLLKNEIVKVYWSTTSSQWIFV